MGTWRNVSLAVTAAAVLTLTTACGQDSGDGSAGARSVGSPAAAGGGGEGYGYGDDKAAAPRRAGQLAARDDAGLGEVVTDSAGMTLYRFDKDTAKPPASRCDGDCAKTWPPVPADAATAVPGTDPSAVGSVTRADGSRQLTLGGRPLYRFARDTEAGDVKGQGVGGTWFAAAPDGGKAAPGARDARRPAASGAPAALPGMSVRKDPELGEIVVDSRGRTVYRFTKDSAWPMKSACTGACLTTWPAVPPVPKEKTVGIRQKGYVVHHRPDGVKQQAVDCWPLYTFSGDTKAGDTNGQGVGGTWYAVSPRGGLVGAPR
ncbi:SCO0930 family lipoprotein [Streptomyces cremeus]|uniref:SCO0930 family lipoprotein n=1 Tax=Streptomyces cremeus TaxID=66881 RepID=A0ABV5PJK0_STRCM